MNFDIFIDFLLLNDQSIQTVVIGAILICGITAVVGCFAFLQKKSLVGDSVSHSVLPGVCIAFLIFETKNPWVLLAGAFLTGWLSILVLDYVTRQSRIKNDAAIAGTLSVFFAVGIMLLTMIQHSGKASQAGLDHFLFGKAAAIVRQDITMFLWTSVILLSIIVVFFQRFKILIFDRAYAASIGFKVGWLDFLLSTLVVVAIAIGIRTVGVVLVAALLITPAASARYWTNNLSKMIFLAAFFGVFAGWIGAFVSYLAPTMPTGPWIIVVLTVVAVFSLVFGKQKGLWYRRRKQASFFKKINDENTLKIFYHLGENLEDFMNLRSISDLQKRRSIEENVLINSLKRLNKRGWVLQSGNKWKLTAKGLLEGKRIIRLHRLWELYLSQHLNVAQDHVHDDAEAIEHILTPEIQKQLEHILEHPKEDPHQKPIPSIN